MEKNLSTVNQKGLQDNQPKFTVFMSGNGVKNMIANACGQNAQRFTASVISAVTTNPALQGCDQRTILSAALLGESLKLSPSPQLGQYYFVPFKDKDRGHIAVFVLGYKGYIQLALRSGYYRKLNVLAIKKGEFVSYDPLIEELNVNLIQDEEERENAETVGYFAMFEYLNGFRKAIYWSKKKMEAHALRYSKGYAAKTGHTFWEKDFDGMAMKTMLRQLLSKWGALSIDLERAIINDERIIEEYNNGIVLADDPTPAPQIPAEPTVDTETGEIISDKQEAAPEKEQPAAPLGTATTEDFSSDDFFK